MFVVKINEESVEFPTTWDEMTTAQYQRVQKAINDDGSLIKCFAAVLNKPYTDIEESHAEILDASIYQLSAFMVNEKMDFKKSNPSDTLTINKIVIPIPKNLGRLTVAQSFQSRVELKENSFELIISKILAIYLQPLFYGTKFNMEQVERLEKIIDTIPIYKTYPICFFFVSKLHNYGASGLLSSLQIKIRQISNKGTQRKKQILKNLNR